MEGGESTEQGAKRIPQIAVSREWRLKMRCSLQIMGEPLTSSGLQVDPDQDGRESLLQPTPGQTGSRAVRSKVTGCGDVEEQR